jgi:hypothetical protein
MKDDKTTRQQDEKYEKKQKQSWIELSWLNVNRTRDSCPACHICHTCYPSRPTHTYPAQKCLANSIDLWRCITSMVQLRNQKWQGEMWGEHDEWGSRMTRTLK